MMAFSNQLSPHSEDKNNGVVISHFSFEDDMFIMAHFSTPDGVSKKGLVLQQGSECYVQTGNRVMGDYKRYYLSDDQKDVYRDFADNNLRQLDLRDVQISAARRMVADKNYMISFYAAAVNYAAIGYSIRNAVLAFHQNNDATMVFGREQWKEYGRSIKAKARAMHIASPKFADHNDYEKMISVLNEILSASKRSNIARYRIGSTNVYFTLNREDEYGVIHRGTQHSFKTETEMRRFFDSHIARKVPIDYLSVSVYDVTDTYTPDILYVKSPKNMNDILRDDLGNPLKNKWGQYQVKNTEERKSRIPQGVQLSNSEEDLSKVRVLSSILSGYDVRNEVSPAESTTALNDRSPLYDAHREAAKFVVLSKFVDIDAQRDFLSKTDCFDKIHDQIKDISFDVPEYMVANSQKVISALSTIYTESRILLADVERDLKGLGYDMQFQPVDQEFANASEDFKDLVYGYHNYAFEELGKNSDRLSDIKEYLTYESNPEIKEIAAKQIRSVSIQNKYLTDINQLAELLAASKTKKDQEKFLQQIHSTIRRIDFENDNYASLNEQLFNGLLEIEPSIKTSFRHSPKEVIESLFQSANISDISKDDMHYLSTSKYVRNNYANLLDGDPKAFIDQLLVRLSEIEMVKSSNGSFVEITSCENFGLKPYFESGALLHPKTAESLFSDAEQSMKELKSRTLPASAEYIPWHRCEIIVYAPNSTGFNGLETRIDIGDGEQSGLIDHLQQVCKDGLSLEILKNVELSLDDSETQKKISNSFVNDLTNKVGDLNDWKNEIGIAKANVESSNHTDTDIQDKERG